MAMEGELNLDVESARGKAMHSNGAGEMEERGLIDGSEDLGAHMDIPICSINIQGDGSIEASPTVIILSPHDPSYDHSPIGSFPTSINVSASPTNCSTAAVAEPMNPHLQSESVPFTLDLDRPAQFSAVPSWPSLLGSGGGRGHATANSGVSFCMSRCALLSGATDGAKRPTDPKVKSAVVRPEPYSSNGPGGVVFSATLRSATSELAESRSGMSLKFEDVSYKVAKRQRRLCWISHRLCSNASSESEGNVKQILDGISGYVKSGEMLALMGPSGSGKTTLLSLLGGRMNAETEVYDMKSSTILYDGVPYNKSLKPRMGYVTQDDVLYPHLTVRETLTYAALLRLPKSTPRHRKCQIADDVIRQLGLEGCRDTIIGNAFLRGVSGGERKRVCIGHEILVDPSLLFLDEPTSGLDSTTALRIISLLKGLAQAGRTVITTIHQPSSRAFYLFDRLLLLAEGHCVYFGEAQNAVQYFEACGFVPVVPAVSPADYLLDLCSGNTSEMNVPFGLVELAGKRQDPSSAGVLQFMLERKEKDGAAALDKPEMKKFHDRPRPSAQEVERMWAVGWVDQVRILLERGFKERRHDYLGWLKVTQVMATALLCSALWWHSSSDSLAHLEDQVGLLFFVALFWGFFPLFNAIFTFPMERAMLAKERSSGMYRLSAYFIARSISDLPLDLLLPTCFLTLVYVMATLRASLVSFLYTLLAVHLTVITAQGVGLLIGAALMDVKKATTVGSVLVIGLMLVAGFFVQHVPKFVAWTKYLSFQSYCYKLLLKIQYSPYHNIGICSGNGATTVECEKALSVTRALHGMHLSSGMEEVWALLALSLVSRLLAYLALHRVRFSSFGLTRKFRHIFTPVADLILNAKARLCLRFT